jgi:S-adenosylmethionine:tRNA ribosyltransferase-isomerase
MSQLKEIQISDFDYPLPDEQIARYPMLERDASKLLVYRNQMIEESTFKSVANFLPASGLMVYNDAKVIKARLWFTKTTGAHIEIFCLEPLQPAEYSQVFASHESCVWKCMTGNLKKWKDQSIEKEIDTEQGKITLRAEKIALHNGWQEIRFSWTPHNISFGEILDAAGKIPIPPYLNRESEQLDNTRYQTIFSATEGSVAAPTAALHFTENVLNSLKEKQIERAKVTLHVGAGTFKPVSTENAMQHNMHAEHFEVSKELCEKLIEYQDNTTAVGTTSVRTLESLYWLGVKALNNEQNLHHLGQWEAYQLPQNITVKASLNAIIQYIDTLSGGKLHATTEIMIVPGYRFRIVNRLITNFHQPKSTLLLLISAFIGDKWKDVYNYALTHQFRFLSYGDSSLLIP